MARTAGPAGSPPEADAQPDGSQEQLVGIGAAAEQAGVSQRALRYYQQIGLLTPQGCTPGGLRRYSADDLARVSRIRQLQTLLGLNLDEIAQVLRGEDRLAEIRLAYHDEGTSSAERRALVRESLELQQGLRATVEAKRQGIDVFLADLDTRIARVQALVDEVHVASSAPQGTR
jgi:DNA-binding transcriptional MerR regulator